MKTLIFLICATFLPASALADRGLQKFLASSQAVQGRQYYLGRMKVPGAAARVLHKTRWGAKRIRERSVIQVTNETLPSYLAHTSTKYLEVMFPAARGRVGHVYFRYGKEVMDFNPEGLRVGEARPIKSDRYAMLVPLNHEQEQAVKSYFKEIKHSWPSTLGKYDFSGKDGFHCVSWFMNKALDSQGRNLAQILGNSSNRRRSSGEAGGVVRFSRFMLKKAAPVEGVMLFKKDPLTSKQLDKLKFDLITHRQLHRAFTKGNHI